MTTMGIVLDELTRERLRRLAERADCSQSAQIRYLVNRECERLFGDGAARPSSDDVKEGAPGSHEFP